MLITYKYKIYHNCKHKDELHDLCRASAFVWNRALALQKRYYKLYGKYIDINKMQKHFAKRENKQYVFLSLMNSQSIQEIIERLDESYKRFFKKIQKRPPKFKKPNLFKSFVFKQGGYKLDGNEIHINKLKRKFKFHLSREYDKNTIRTVRITRDSVGDFYICIVFDDENLKSKKEYIKTHDGASVGIDFGLKSYLTISDKTVVNSPLFFKQNLKEIKKLSKNLSKKKKGSNNRKKARIELASKHRDVVHMKEDFMRKLSHDLCKKYDYIFIEDLSLNGMSRLWGRKMCDLAHGKFLLILQQVANKYGVTINKIDKFYPSSKTCSVCGAIKTDLSLKDRIYHCEKCKTSIDRDYNASLNIMSEGICSYRRLSKTCT